MIILDWTVRLFIFSKYEVSTGNCDDPDELPSHEESHQDHYCLTPDLLLGG